MERQYKRELEVERTGKRDMKSRMWSLITTISSCQAGLLMAVLELPITFHALPVDGIRSKVALLEMHLGTAILW